MRRAVSGLLVVVALTVSADAGGLLDNPGLVLDIEEGSWRLFMGWKTPTLITADGERKPLLWRTTVGAPAEKRGAVPVRRSWYPPATWAQPDFDDTYWPRTRGRVVIPQPPRFGDMRSPGHPAEWNLVCLRGRFMVTDPAKVVMPKLELSYYGGAVIYVNGKELHRGHLPKGKIDFETPAHAYPLEAYVRPDGSLYGFKDSRDADFADRFAKRVRRCPPKVWVAAVGIPKRMLRKGVNVIAIEVHAAPVNEVAAEGKAKAGTWKERPCSWPHAGVVEARLSVGLPKGLEPNVAPSEGLNIGTCHPWETLRVHDYAHPWDEIQPMALVGARNGSFSGRVVVSSRDSIFGLKAKATALVQTGGEATIPADAVRVRYAEPCNPRVGWRRWPYFDRLLDEAPDEIPATPITIRGRKLLPVPTALVPVWVTVRVPADAAPGDYQGTLSIEAEDADPVTVPIRLKVYDFRLPDPKDFRLTHNIYQSPDSVAMYYKVPKWSDRHFELMAKSFAVLGRIGSRVLCLNLCERASNLNNVHSIVRWVKQPDGSFTYDFSIAERYMDLYEKTVGKPRALAIYIMDFEGRTNEAEPRPVTVLDPKTGELESLQQPPYGTKENMAFWKPVLTELRERLKKRGWYDVAMIGHVSYCWSPTKETAANIKAIWPDGKWISSCHGYRSQFGGLPVLCNEWVWAAGRLYNPDANNPRYTTYPRPWRKTRAGFPVTDLKIWRGGFRDHHPLSAYRAAGEGMLQRNLHGFGRLGGDFWPVPMGKEGRLGHLSDTRYALGHAINVIAMISPGPDGAIANERVEAFREGVQIAETIAFVRQSLDDKKVEGQLATRAEDLLLERARHYCRTGWGTRQHWLALAASGAHVRDEHLYAIAAASANSAAKGE